MSLPVVSVSTSPPAASLSQNPIPLPTQEPFAFNATSEPKSTWNPKCGAKSAICSASNPCIDGLCYSQLGYCVVRRDYYED